MDLTFYCLVKIFRCTWTVSLLSPTLTHCFHLPEQKEEAVDLQHDSNDGPANEHHKHTSEEETGGLHLVLLEEEAEGSLQPNDEGKSSNKQDLQKRKKQV